MVGTDSYYTSLNDIACEIENVYGITKIMQSGDSDIASVVQSVNNSISKMDKEEVAKKNIEAGKSIILLSYLCFRFEFFRIIRFDFSVFYAVDEIYRVLSLFRNKDGFNGRNLRLVNRIIKILAKSDENSTKVRYGLTYRYLRIFIVLVLHNSSCNASVVTNLLLEQMMLQNLQEVK